MGSQGILSGFPNCFGHAHQNANKAPFIFNCEASIGLSSRTPQGVLHSGSENGGLEVPAIYLFHKHFHAFIKHVQLTVGLQEIVGQS